MSYYLVKWILANMKTNELATWLAMNYHFIIIPVANPWGYEQPSRGNSRGVDLNRNFNANWAAGTSYDDLTHGASAASELETQRIQAVIDANLDAYTVMDYHSHMAGSNVRQILASSQLDIIQKSYDVVKFTNMVGINVENAQTYTDVPIGSACAYGVKNNIQSCTLEAAVFDSVEGNYKGGQLTNDMYQLIGMLRFNY